MMHILPSRELANLSAIPAGPVFKLTHALEQINAEMGRPGDAKSYLNLRLMIKIQ